MSTIATIAVNQCDGCGCVATLQTDEDYGSFGANWYDGTWVHYCPDCRHLSVHQAAIEEDQDLLDLIATAVRRSPRTEVAHAR